ncbi:MAG: hypothetical protein ACOY45_06880 [Pseudomonadota bacterium]
MMTQESNSNAPIQLADLDEAIAPASPVTTIAGGALFVVVVLAMVPGAVDTSFRRS